MTLSSYLLYVAAVALLIVTPGPTMLMCMTNSLNHGPRRAMTSVAGAVTAVLCVDGACRRWAWAPCLQPRSGFTVRSSRRRYLIWLGIKTSQRRG
jgi:threonine/homoserine/homoserine lactone efflux protein